MSLENLMRKELFFELSGGQRRTIATTLTILDEALCEFELWAKGREVRSVLYSETKKAKQAFDLRLPFRRNCCDIFGRTLSESSKLNPHHLYF
jgi:hypothetical protein